MPETKVIAADDPILNDICKIVNQLQQMPPTREKQLTITKLEEAMCWYGFHLDRNKNTGL